VSARQEQNNNQKRKVEIWRNWKAGLHNVHIPEIDRNEMPTQSIDPEKLHNVHIPEIKKNTGTHKVMIRRNCIAGLDNVRVPDMSKKTMKNAK
jgi:hypothetical protein